jgi:hypothetical protein
VLLGGVSLVMDGGPDDDQVAVSPARRPSGAAAQLPDTVSVHCTPNGIEIPVASVRPQRDGMHLRVFNELTTSTEVRVVKDDEWAGRRSFAPGMWPLLQPVPPGTLRIGCVINGVERSLTVELVDVHRYYREPKLECPSGDKAIRETDLQGAEPDKSMSTATLNAVRSKGIQDDGLEAGAMRGYPSQRLDYSTEEPKLQVSRRGDTVGFVQLRRDDPEAPWKVATIDACQSFLSEATTTETTAASG